MLRSPSAVCSANSERSRGSARWKGQHSPITLLSESASSSGVLASVKAIDFIPTQERLRWVSTGK
eukprot:scaffold93499_cov58-Phaeocystis_antarctica.AAC.4